jgi:hypothetical protein
VFCAGAALLGTALMGEARAVDVELDFANVPGAAIEFDPDDPGAGFTGSFYFTSNAAGDDFIITDVSPLGMFAAFGKLGDITGEYAIGAIASPFAGFETATVTPIAGMGPHTFVIHDTAHGVGSDFSGTIAWIDIFTFGTAGGLNAGGTVNLTGITYAGANPALIALATDPTQIVTLTFQFTPAMSLTALTTDDASDPEFSTSFSGTLEADVDPDDIPEIPEPASVVLLLGSMACVGGVARFRRR